MKQIVIYEEDDITRGLMHEWLSEAGYRVCSGKLRDANCQTAADLGIVSVYMPKHAGARCVGDIKRAHPGAPLIAISGQFRSGLSAGGPPARGVGGQRG